MEPRLLGGRYVLSRRLGVGGMAEVWLALDRTLGREVAVKLLHSVYATDPAFIERFRREARAAAALNHPHIVSVYDWGVDSDAYYMVMEFVPGANLKEVVRERGPLPEETALRIGEEIASALAAAHRRGVVHRDVKPHNVLLDAHGQAKVTDFGIARTGGTSHLTAASAVIGTAHYISPEQAQSRPADGRSDIYSLGVVLYEMLTGQVPFAGDIPLAVAWQHVHDAPPALREVRPGLSPETERLVTTALAKSPEGRYQSAEAMRQSIAWARAGLSALARDGAAVTVPLATGAATPASRVPAAPAAEPDVPTPLEPPPRPGTGTTTVARSATPSSVEPPPGLSAGSGAGPGTTTVARPVFPPATLPVPRPTAPIQPPAAQPPAAQPQRTQAQGVQSKVGQSAPPSRRRLAVLAPWVLTLLGMGVLTAAGAARWGATGRSGFQGAPSGTASPVVVTPAGSGGPAPAGPAASPSAASPSALVPTARPAPTTPPTVAPTAPPEPTSTPPPVPTPSPAPPSPTMAAAPAAGAAAPGDAVRSFYDLVGQREFAGAAQLWSARMQASYPPVANIDGRFAQTQELRLQRADVLALDQSSGRATVAVELVEVIGNPPRTQRISGTWQVVRGGQGWLLDQPNLQVREG